MVPTSVGTVPHVQFVVCAHIEAAPQAFIVLRWYVPPAGSGRHTLSMCCIMHEVSPPSLTRATTMAHTTCPPSNTPHLSLQLIFRSTSKGADYSGLGSHCSTLEPAGRTRAGPGTWPDASPGRAGPRPGPDLCLVAGSIYGRGIMYSPRIHV